MAQLIKLQDFISRYETDIFRYPSQYIRLKKERWGKIQAVLTNGEETRETIPSEQQLEGFAPFDGFDETWLEDEKKGFFKSIKHFFKKRKENSAVYNIDTFNRTPEIIVDPMKSEEEIKRGFLDELFQFQINWASSTIRDRSFVDQGIYKDDILKYFLQHFPDNYLVLYKPTIIVKKAPIDLDIILMSPIATYCISIIESAEMSVFTTDRGRYWFEGPVIEAKKRINPMISLNRTESLIQSYYNHYEINLPVKKIVLSRNGYIEGKYEPTNTLLIDKRNYSNWYTKMRNLSSPIKFVQLKGAQVLLKHSQSTYVRRYEWGQEEENMEWDDERQ